jgi:glutathione S-transferase kappa 1
MVEKGTLKAMRFLTCVAQRNPSKLEETSRQLWMRIWSRDEDITEPENIAAAGKLAGLTEDQCKEYLALSDKPEVKDALKKNTEEASGFGVS